MQFFHEPCNVRDDMMLTDWCACGHLCSMHHYPSGACSICVKTVPLERAAVAQQAALEWLKRAVYVAIAIAVVAMVLAMLAVA